MRIADSNWMMLERCLRDEDRCVLPLGSVEQHAYLSLCVDMILSEKVAVDAAAPLGIPVFPAQPFGVTPYFSDFPGTVTLRLSTYIALIDDILESLYRSGFRRILLVNGHGGNSPIQGFLSEWMARRRDARVRLHDWWKSPRTWAEVQRIDPAASHASWMENFPWTRIPGVVLPEGSKPQVDYARLQVSNPAQVRELVGDGNYHGLYARNDQDMMRLWDVAVEETRQLLESGWG